MNRRTFLKGALVTGTALTFPPVFSILRGASARRPNVLFIAVDDLRPQMGCYGFSKMKTPNFDALASSGCLFKQAYCQQAVCSPSRTSLVTGQRPDVTKVYDLKTHFRKTIPGVITLPECFKQNGYTTQAIGKIFHGNLDDPQSWSVPWDKDGVKTGPPIPRVEGYTSEEGMRVIRQRIAEDREKAKLQGRDEEGMHFGMPYEIEDIDDDQHGDGCVAVGALQRLQQLQKQPDVPFFLGVGFRKPHLPFLAPRKYWDLYPEDQISLDEHPFRPKGTPDIALHNWGELRAYAGVPKTGPLPDDLARTLIRGYYACTSFIDAQVGRLIASLKELKLWDNTIIVLWGDHGFHLGDHGLWCKHTNFETAVHAPLMVRDPRCEGGLSYAAPTEFVDIYPTLCSLSGITPTQALSGRSLASAVEGRASEVPVHAAFSQYPRPGNVMGYSMRTERYRCTVWEKRDSGERVASEVYDDQNDPAEINNLTDVAGNEKLAQQLIADLDRESPRVFPARKLVAATVAA